MRRFWIILLSLVALAGCDANAPPPAALPPPGVTASFPPGGLVNVIQVNALDPLPLRSAELVAPDGSTTPAGSINVDANPQAIAGQHALTDPWRSGSLGPNGFNPAPGALTDPSPYAVHQLLMTVSTAQITLPDAVAYRRDWQNYKIRLGFAGSGHPLDTREIPAPEPPPAPQSGG